MSFANLKKSSKNSFSDLAAKIQEDTSKKSYADDRFWKLDLDKAGNASAVIRFLPTVDGEDMPYVKTYKHAFKTGGKWFIEECPTTIGEKCYVCEENGKLWSEGTDKAKELARQRKRKLKYVSNVLIVSNPADPSMEGKVVLYSYGAKIFEKIMSKINPEFDDEVAMNPFDFWEGANFKLRVRTVEKFPNYDKCEFESPSQLFDGDDEALEKLWKSQYPLKSLHEASIFKSFSDIKEKFVKAVNVSQGTEETEEFENMVTKVEEKLSKPAKPTDVPFDTDDDDMAMFKQLLDD